MCVYRAENIIKVFEEIIYNKIADAIIIDKDLISGKEVKALKSLSKIYKYKFIEGKNSIVLIRQIKNLNEIFLEIQKMVETGEIFLKK